MQFDLAQNLTAIDRAKNSFDNKFFRNQLRKVGIYRLKKTKYFSFFLTNRYLELSPNKYFDTSYYLELHPEARNLGTHPYISYLENGYLQNNIFNMNISLEEIRTIRTKSIYSPVEELFFQENKSKYESTTLKFFKGLNKFWSVLSLIWNIRHESIQRLKLIVKLFTLIKPGKTYRSAYENYSRICSLIGLSGGFNNILKTDCHNESGRYSISIPLTPILTQYSNQVDCIELDESVINDAQKFTNSPENCHIHNGSITSLPFGKSQFDCILDFSTIDHLTSSEAEVALTEYLRVAKDKALVIVIVWIDDYYSVDKDNLQTYFSEKDFSDLISKHFFVYFQRDILNIESARLKLFALSQGA